MREKRLHLEAVIIASLLSGVISSFIGVLVLYFLVLITERSYEDITAFTITVTAVFSSFVAGMFYYGIAEYTKHFRVIFTVLGATFGVLSTLPNLLVPIDEGIELFVVVLHLSVTAAILTIIPPVSESVINDDNVKK